MIKLKARYDREWPPRARKVATDHAGRGLRKAIAHIQRHHKRTYMLAGGRGKNPRPPVEGYIVNRSHVLKRSHKVEVSPKNLYAAYGSAVKYAPFLEYGTRWIKARETLLKTERDTADDVAKIIADEVQKGLDKS